MPISDPFLSQAAAPDRIAYDFYTKLWRLVHEFRATEALSTPRTPDSLYWYEYETDAGTRVSPSLPTPNEPLLFWEMISVATPSQIPRPLHIFRQTSRNIDAFQKTVEFGLNL
jgi:hypothetical protein